MDSLHTTDKLSNIIYPVLFETSLYISTLHYGKTLSGVSFPQQGHSEFKSN